MPIITRFGGGAGLRLRVNAHTVLPDSAKENEIAVLTEVPIPHFAIAAENPFLKITKERDLLDGIALSEGSITSLGNIAAQNGTNLEVYTEAYLPVEYGKTYAVDYALAESKSMWLAICEYSGEDFVQRLTPVNSVTGTAQTITYTPSADTVTAVRLSWRTYGLETSVTFVAPRSVTTKEETEIGTVWIKTGTSEVSFFADRKQTLRIELKTVQQYRDGTWENREAHIYQGGWVNFSNARVYLYKHGDVGSADTWLTASSAGGCTITESTDSIEFRCAGGSSNARGGSFYIDGKQNLSGVSTVKALLTRSLSDSSSGSKLILFASDEVVSDRTATPTFDAMMTVDAQYDSPTEVSLSVNFDGEKYVGLYMYTSSGITQVSNVQEFWLE